MDKLRVLVVDDEPGMRLAVERVLQQYTVRLPEVETEVGFELELAASGEEALEKIERSRPDLMLLDHKLPRLSGLDVLNRLAEDKAAPLTIMITAYASLETAVAATKRGAFDFLAKPFTPEELKAAIYKAAKQIVLERQARKLAREKKQFRFQMISVVAHELKAPLAAIEQYLDILYDRTLGDNPEAYNQMLQRSLARVQGMRKLITDLLDLTRIESGQKKRELIALDVRALAETALETVRPDAQPRGISLALPAGPPAPMIADRWEIEIILNNLLTNAVKYNRDAGRVDATVEAKDGKIILRVEDTGIGMAPEDAARLFQEFVRIKSAETESISGSGLGLSIVKKIALLYGGEVAVESQPGRGSVFTVVLNAGLNEARVIG
jgi:signal transduction histidine kinase